jgi:hypothetical protein
MDCEISKSWRPPYPYLTVSLKTIYHHLPLGLVLPEVTEELFLIRIILADPLQASLYPTIYIVWIKCQPEVEDLPIVAVIVADSCPASEALFSSPTG